MKKRSVVAVVIFTIITLGIYSIYWTYVMAEDMNKKDTTKPPLMNFILAILLGIVTCGIYELYWFFRFYEKSDAVTKKNNLIVYFILGLFGFNIISMALLQSDVNALVEE